MEFDIRLPSITAKDPDGQLRQINSYLYQLAGQLQYAMGTVDANAHAIEQALEQSQITVKQASDPQKVFNNLKNLIIKSADIVTAYSEEISTRLSGTYVAKSEYGTFTENTEMMISENSRRIEAVFDNVQTIGGDVSTMTGYIHAGQLYEAEDGTPVLGVEIGQTTEDVEGSVYRGSVRIITNRISFFDINGSEVAYISDKRLHITTAEVQTITATSINAKQIQMGNYIISVSSDGHFSIT